MAEQNENIKYIVRIASTNLDGTMPAVYALANVKGIGYRTAEVLLKKMKIPRNVKLGEIDDAKLEEIKDAIEKKYKDFLPSWTLNHQKDIQTGEDLFKFGPDLEVALSDDVNRMKRIRSYKGIRHEKGRKVRGQRTRANGRHGLAVGVVKKREAPATAEKKEGGKE